MSQKISLKMSQEKSAFATESFANLVGEVQPIKCPSLSPLFGLPLKRKQERRIAEQNRRLDNARGNELLTENFAALPSSEIRAMQTGQVPIRREWDFHGYFVEDALQILRDALDERRNRQPEYWHIVHGKGRNSSIYDKAPLKHAIFALLREHQAVLAALSQLDSDGKSGAVVAKIKARSPR